MSNLSKWAPHVLAVLRIVTALLFLDHGTRFLQLAAAIPGVIYPLLVVAGAIEVFTAVLVMLGFYTRAAALLASGEMAAAYFMYHAPQSFWPAVNMGESAIMFCCVFLYLAFAGPGTWAIDNMRRARSTKAPAASA
ncbi:DoxX family protein [Bradyrhizobium sp. Arg314]